MYSRPQDLADATRQLAADGLTIVAGGTDFYPARVGRAISEPLLDISAISELRGIAQQTDHWRIGALTTWQEIRDADLPPSFAALQQAAAEVGGAQIQNRATIAGNICNASPAADGVPPLLALDAEVELCAAGETRRLPLAEFITGNRETRRRKDELVTAILVPVTSAVGQSRFLKLGSRAYLVISIVMAAVRVETDKDRRIQQAAISVGSCSAVALRLPELEQALTGQILDRNIGAAVQTACFSQLTPIDDCRAAADYRQESAVTLVRRALVEVAAGGPA